MHNSVKIVRKVTVLVLSYCLIMVYVCIKFSIDILSGFRIMKRGGFQQ